MLETGAITRGRIAAVEPHIRPFAEFGRPAFPVDLKLECLQHSGSFKARGAFTNLLERQVPAALWSPPPAAIMAPPSPMPP